MNSIQKHSARHALLVWLSGALCLGVSFLTETSHGGTLLMEGKCAIPERSVAYKRCAVMNDGSTITVLAGPNQQFVQQILLSDIILAGALTNNFGLTSPQFAHTKRTPPQFSSQKKPYLNYHNPPHFFAESK